MMSASAGSTSSGGLLFRQLFDQDSWTYTYLVADLATRRALLVDPVIEQVKRDSDALARLGLDLAFVINTHCHADHITGSGFLKETFPNARSVLGFAGNETAVADLKLRDGEILEMDAVRLEARHTPGHTAGCMTLVEHSQGFAFTGDTLLVQGCGRTDFQGGSASTLHDSIHTKVLSLPAATQLWPAHDYNGRSVTSVEEERRFNPRTSLGKAAFVELMNGLNLPYPRKMDESLPPNLKCGLYDLPERFKWHAEREEKVQASNKVLEHVKQLQPSAELAQRVRAGKIFVLDVRDPDELSAGAATLPKYTNVALADLGQARLPDVPKETPILLVCRSGIRSQQAGKLLRGLGFSDLHNLVGGAVAWSKTIGAEKDVDGKGSEASFTAQ
jgi:sulfur dioxygenase